jgi:hypothetical protein
VVEFDVETFKWAVLRGDMSSILVVGTISNVEKRLEKDLCKVVQSLKRFERIFVYLVESDSLDGTVELLEQIKKNTSNFEYISLGSLAEIYPNRIQRLRLCRNKYIPYIRDFIEDRKIDYVCIADLDGMNPKITSKAVDSCFDALLDWDVCFSNQLHGYSDLYALRCDDWVSTDVFEELAESQSRLNSKFESKYWFKLKPVSFLVRDFLRKRIIYQRMHRISAKARWIPVNSAFGGLAIYKSNLFLTSDYGNPLDDSLRGSEHVELHRQMMVNRSKMYINPGLINANWNTYNVNRYFLVRHLRELTRSNWFFLRLKNLVRR